MLQINSMCQRLGACKCTSRPTGCAASADLQGKMHVEVNRLLIAAWSDKAKVEAAAPLCRCTPSVSHLILIPSVGCFLHKAFHGLLHRVDSWQRQHMLCQVEWLSSKRGLLWCASADIKPMHAEHGIALLQPPWWLLAGALVLVAQEHLHATTGNGTSCKMLLWCHTMENVSDHAQSISTLHACLLRADEEHVVHHNAV